MAKKVHERHEVVNSSASTTFLGVKSFTLVFEDQIFLSFRGAPTCEKKELSKACALSYKRTNVALRRIDREKADDLPLQEKA